MNTASSWWRRTASIGILAAGLSSIVATAREPVTLTLAHPTWFKDHTRYLEWYIPQFEKRMAARGTPVRIEVVDLPAGDDAYRKALVLRLYAGAAPDIFLLDTFYIPADALAGYLLDLTDRVHAWEWDQWIDPAKEAVTFQGRIWGLIRSVGVRPLYYRTDIFHKAGLPVPWQPTSWQDLLTTARTIKRRVPGVAPLALKAGSRAGESTTMQGFYMVLLGAGGRLYDEEHGKWIVKSTPLVETLRFYRTIYLDEQLSVPPEFWLAGNPVEDIHLRLRDGKLAMLVSWDTVWYDSSDPSHKRFIPDPPGRDAVLGFAKMPAQAPGAGIRGQSFVTIAGGWAEVINGNIDPEKADLAWEWLTFVYSKHESRSHIVQVGPGELPARKDTTEDPAWRAQADAYTKWLVRELAPLATFRPGLPAYPQISDLIQEATDRILLGEPPQAVLDWYARQVTKRVKRHNTIVKP